MNDETKSDVMIRYETVAAELDAEIAEAARRLASLRALRYGAHNVGSPAAPRRREPKPNTQDGRALAYIRQNGPSRADAIASIIDRPRRHSQTVLARPVNRGLLVRTSTGAYATPEPARAAE